MKNKLVKYVNLNEKMIGKYLIEMENVQVKKEILVLQKENYKLHIRLLVLIIFFFKLACFYFHL